MIETAHQMETMISRTVDGRVGELEKLRQVTTSLRHVCNLNNDRLRLILQNVESNRQFSLLTRVFRAFQYAFEKIAHIRRCLATMSSLGAGPKKQLRALLAAWKHFCQYRRVKKMLSGSFSCTSDESPLHYWRYRLRGYLRIWAISVVISKCDEQNGISEDLPEDSACNDFYANCLQELDINNMKVQFPRDFSAEVDDSKVMQAHRARVIQNAKIEASRGRPANAIYLVRYGFAAWRKIVHEKATRCRPCNEKLLARYVSVELSKKGITEGAKEFTKVITRPFLGDFIKLPGRRGVFWTRCFSEWQVLTVIRRQVRKAQSYAEHRYFTLVWQVANKAFQGWSFLSYKSCKKAAHDRTVDDAQERIRVLSLEAEQNIAALEEELAALSGYGQWSRCEGQSDTMSQRSRPQLTNFVTRDPQLGMLGQ